MTIAKFTEAAQVGATKIDQEATIAAGWARWKAMPEGDERNVLVGQLWQLEDRADDIDDLRRDVLLDRLAGVHPECIGDLLELADQVFANEIGGAR